MSTNIDKEEIRDSQCIQNFSIDDGNTPEAPRFASSPGLPYVPFGYNRKNNYPDYLIGLFDNSALHGSILERKIAYVAGSGFIVDEEHAKAKETIAFLENINSQYDADEILNRTASDNEIHNSLAWVVTFNRAWNKILSIQHTDISKWRATPVDEFGKIRGYYYNFKWKGNATRPADYLPTLDFDQIKENAGKVEEALKEVARNRNNVAEEKYPPILTESTSMIMYNKPYQPGEFYYAKPYYSGAINAIRADIAADEYAATAMENGMSIDYHIEFIGSYNDTAKKKEAKSFYRMHTGARKAGKPLVTFAKDKDKGTKITKLDATGEDKRYTSINENAMTKILSAHGVTSPGMFGIMTPGKLGESGTELQDREEVFHQTVIYPRQKRILKYFNRLLEFNDLAPVTIERLLLFEDEVEEVDSETGVKNQKGKVKDDGKTKLKKAVAYLNKIIGG